MPLFKVKVTRTVEIPVDARSADEAVRYMESSRAWRDAEAFTRPVFDREALTVIGAEPITNPIHEPYEGNVLCYGPRADEADITVAQSFLGGVAATGKSARKLIAKYNSMREGRRTRDAFELYQATIAAARGRYRSR